MIQLPEINGLTVIAIQQAVTAYYEISMVDLLSVRRIKESVQARSVAMWLARRYTDLSYPQIGRMFGDRDHATVMAACARIDQALKADAAVSDDIRQITATLAAALKRDAHAQRLRRDTDPLQVAVDHVNSGRTPNLSSWDARLILMLFVSYAMAAGDVRDADQPEVIEAPARPTPPPVPQPEIRTSALNLLVSRAQAVIGRRSEVEANRYSKFEKSSREAFEAALDALETSVNVLTGKASK